MTVANQLRAVNLRHFRLKRGLSQIAMAEKCRFPQSNVVSMMEGGAMPISIKAVDRIAAASNEPATLKALGDRWKISRERVRQLEKRILMLLRDHNLLENP